ncbi:MAG TPA: Crp/Fnr family transcriptional regulator [Xanthobacteraceae bacterium]|nr:Crp/Fnr family transcriptional regulator [Xanthobacteraceae bacterium]
MARDTLFSVLPPNLSEGLIAQARTVAFAPDQVLFRTGDACDGCYHVIEGVLKVAVVLPSGRERILAILGPGGFIGELSLVDGSPRSASVIALKAAKLYFISRAKFDAFAAAHPEIYRHIADLLARRLRDNSATLALSSLSIKARAAHALLSLAEAFGKDVGAGRVLVRQKVSQADLAAMAGIARENLSRILQDWMRDKVVSRLAGYYCLERKEALERAADA